MAGQSIRIFSRPRTLTMTPSGDFAATMPTAIATSERAAEVDLRLDLIKAQEISGHLAEDWRLIRSTHPDLASPYFDLEFTKSVARVRDDVEVAVFSADDEVFAMLPFQRASARHGVPVGGRLNDSHGLLTRFHSRHQVSPRELIERTMKVANLDSFAFHSLSQLDSSLSHCEFEELGSYHLDLSEGWPAYREWVRKHSSTVKRQGQKTRALEREVGPLRFDFDCQDGEVLETLIELKRSKYQRTNTFDILSVEWASNLLRDLSTVEESGFKGLLSVLWAGEKLIAVHFGMLTDDILHYWFPVYDPAYQRYSPGTELLLRVAETAADSGVKKLDLGYGDDDYKFRFCNGQEIVSCGQVNTSPLGFQIAKQRYHFRQKLKGIPMKPFVKTVLRGVYPGFGQWNFK